MEENESSNVENKSVETNIKPNKINFFKKIGYSITKFEKYPEMSKLGLRSAVGYFLMMVLIVSIILTGIYVYYIEKVEQYDESNLNLAQKFATQISNLGEYYGTDFSENVAVLENTSSTNIVFSLFVGVFIIMLISLMFVMIFLSVVGLITTKIARLKLTYRNVLSMTIYAMTLSTLLIIIYTALNMIANFEIKYFDVMYIAISYIYIVTAIFMIKYDTIKQQIKITKGR